jgi:hypothetical protein
MASLNCRVKWAKRCFSVVFAVFLALKLHLLGQNGTVGCG